MISCCRCADIDQSDMARHLLIRRGRSWRGGASRFSSNIRYQWVYRYSWSLLRCSVRSIFGSYLHEWIGRHCSSVGCQPYCMDCIISRWRWLCAINRLRYWHGTWARTRTTNNISDMRSDSKYTMTPARCSCFIPLSNLGMVQAQRWLIAAVLILIPGLAHADTQFTSTYSWDDTALVITDAGYLDVYKGATLITSVQFCDGDLDDYGITYYSPAAGFEYRQRILLSYQCDGVLYAKLYNNYFFDYAPYSFTLELTASWLDYSDSADYYLDTGTHKAYFRYANGTDYAAYDLSYPGSWWLWTQSLPSGASRFDHLNSFYWLDAVSQAQVKDCDYSKVWHFLRATNCGLIGAYGTGHVVVFEETGTGITSADTRMATYDMYLIDGELYQITFDISPLEPWAYKAVWLVYTDGGNLLWSFYPFSVTLDDAGGDLGFWSQDGLDCDFTEDDYLSIVPHGARCAWSAIQSAYNGILSAKALIQELFKMGQWVEQRWWTSWIIPSAHADIEDSFNTAFEAVSSWPWPIPIYWATGKAFLYGMLFLWITFGIWLAPSSPSAAGGGGLMINWISVLFFIVFFSAIFGALAWSGALTQISSIIGGLNTYVFSRGATPELLWLISYMIIGIAYQKYKHYRS